jgi:Ca2+-binding RTX toxin-like protein
MRLRSEKWSEGRMMNVKDHRPGERVGRTISLLERLERRTLLDSVIDGVLTADGTAGNDTVAITATADNIIIDLNGAQESFPIHLVTSIDYRLGEGDDSLTVGAGVPAIAANGGAGNDTIVGGDSSDSLAGGAGDDSLSGAGGDDSLMGGAGSDTLLGQGGSDTLDGGDGNDIAFGGGGSNIVHGNAGDDTLMSGPGSDQLIGGDGDDCFINGGGNADTVAGGPGFNYVQLDPADSITAAQMIYDPDTSGTTSVTSQAASNAVGAGTTQVVTASVKAGVLVVAGTSGDDVVAIRLIGGSYLLGASGGVAQTFSADGITGVSISGLAGDDVLGVDNVVTVPVTIVGGGGADTLAGGTGSDSMIGGPGDDVLIGLGGNDTLVGGKGDDTLRSGAGNDSDVGGAGNDRLIGSIGDDTLLGGAGNDLLTPGKHKLGDGNDGADFVSGGPGVDTADFSEVMTDMSITLDGIANDGPAGVGANIMPDVENLFGGLGNDTIVGTAAANFLSGGAGNDSISGGGGKDVLVASRGNDTLNPGGGPSVIAAFNGSQDEYTTVAGDVLNVDSSDVNA